MVCAGKGGWKIAIGQHGLTETLVFVRPGHALGEPTMDPRDGRDIRLLAVGPSDKVSWVGSTAIVPLQILALKDHERLIEDGAPVAGMTSDRILAVYRLGKEGVCALAYADLGDKDAPRLAGEAAAMAAEARCPVAGIRVLGRASAALLSYMKN